LITEHRHKSKRRPQGRIVASGPEDVVQSRGLHGSVEPGLQIAGRWRSRCGPGRRETP
jgi:hypothetical protein